MNWTHAVIAEDPTEVITLEQAKSNLDVTFNDDDTLIQSYIDAAVGWVQNHTGRFLKPTTVEVYADRFATPLNMPFSPFRSLVSVNSGGSLVAARSIAGEYLALLPASGARWPSAPQELGSVVVRYIVGFEPGKVPPVFLQAVKLVVSIFYDKPDGKDLEAQWKSARDLLSGFRSRNL